MLRAGLLERGTWRWTYASGGHFVANYELNTLAVGRPVVRLSYSFVWTATQEQESHAYLVFLTTTRPRFGGLRWWFLCPLTVNGRPCNRRVGKLYLPPSGRYFGCRHCYDLTYTSCQESRKYDGLYRLLAREMGEDPVAIKRLMRRLGKDY
jgi:hypothetical protein